MGAELTSNPMIRKLTFTGSTAVGAMLLAGCEIGEECVIGAGALIGERKKIPPRSLVVGMPGRIVRAVTDEDVAKIRHISAHYKEMAARHAAGEFPPPWGREGRA